MSRLTYNWYDKQAKLREFYQQLQKDNDGTQVTVTNHTEDIRNVCLWGANASMLLTDPLFLVKTINVSVVVDTHPQMVVYNEVNDSFYVANQLSDSVSVISSSGILKTTIALRSFKLPGSVSPVAIAVNNRESSSDYGMIAVACSVSNEVVLIRSNNLIYGREPLNSDSNEITSIESTGIRPIDIAYNKFDDCFYIANLVSGLVSKLSTTGEVTMLPQIQNPRSIGINTDNGDLYVYNGKKKRVNIYDIQGNLKGKQKAMISDIVSFAYHPANKQMYIGLNDTNSILVINPVTFKTTERITVGNDPVTLEYNSHNGLMYVANRGDQNYTRLDSENQVVDTVELGNFNLGLAISTKENIIATSNASTHTVTIRGEKKQPTVTVNEEYYEDREDFQHNPTLINHLKIVASGEDRLHALQLLEQSISGKESCKTISLSNYQSSQNFCNVSEVFDIAGTIIDGHLSWFFKINPMQKVTFLIYHKQFEMYNVLPEKSRISTGVQMSKGIPESWLNNYQDELHYESHY